jgi:hypothetical protein
MDVGLGSACGSGSWVSSFRQRIPGLVRVYEGAAGKGHPGARTPCGLGDDPLYSLGRAPALSHRRPPKLAGMDAVPSGDDRGQKVQA